MTDRRASAAAVRRWPLAPLYGAGFLTAFGAHGVAANLGVLCTDQVASLLVGRACEDAIEHSGTGRRQCGDDGAGLFSAS